MPCNWPTTACSLLRRVSFNGVSRTRLPNPKLPVAVRTSWCANLTRPRGLASVAFVREDNSSLPHPLQSLPQPSSGDLPQSPSEPSSLHSATAHLSAAQVSRAAAKTVRLCISEGGFGDALYIVNSACHSVLRGPLRTDPEGENQPARPSQLEPIAFGQPVSPRLAAHAFLHGLIRRGYTRKATTYAEHMIKVGIPMRPRTLETIVTMARRSPKPLPELGPFARVLPRRLKAAPTVLQLQSSVVANTETRAVLELLQTARTFGQKRTERMYRVLIETLIMQGEIIVASLLFVLLIKDWELRQLQEGAAQEMEEGITHDVLAVSPPSPAVLLASPYPDLKAMGKIIDAVQYRISGSSDGDLRPNSYPYLQGLAMFAMLLDTGQIHTHRVAAIMRAMYSCPRTSIRVWVLNDGEPVSVEAYSYFHEVLQRMVDSLARDQLPNGLRLSRRAYNTLLSYSLRDRLSPAMASQVLHHMCVRRVPPIPPDIVTYNVLLRSGTLLRQMSISEVALHALRLGAQESGTSTVLDDLAPTQDDEFSAVATNGSSASDTTVSATEEFVMPNVTNLPQLRFKINKHTVTNFVTHLTSTGRPEVVASSLFSIIPELYVIDHPATNGIPRPPTFTLSRRDALKRAVRHGPYVYASIINALCKAGEVGLAERVFILAQQAQQASNLPTFADSTGPWTLPQHAYTSLMQCYTRVVRGRLPRHKRSRNHVGSALLDRDSIWRSKAGHHRAGYAQYVHLVSATGKAAGDARHTKRQTSRHNAMLLYRSMMSGGRALLAALVTAPVVRPTGTSSRPAPPRGSAPRPDARFFNAALRLFSTPPRERTPRHVVLHGYNLQHRISAGVATRNSSTPPMLRKVIEEMVQYGYDVPRAYWHLLRRGQLKRARALERRRRAPVRRPYAFERVQVHGCGERSIPVVKTRGLPVRRKGLPLWLSGKRRTRTAVDVRAGVVMKESSPDASSVS